MNKKSIATILTVLILGSSFFNSENRLESNGTIGDVKYSVLPENRFIQLNNGWVLMDGRDVTGSKFHRITGFSSIPDGQNQFIRGMGGNFDETNKELNGSPRTVGSQQIFSTAKPKRYFWGVTGKIDRKGKSSEEFYADTDFDYNATWLLQSNNKRKLDGGHKHKFKDAFYSETASHNRGFQIYPGDRNNKRGLKGESDSNNSRWYFDSYTDQELLGEYGNGHVHELIVYKGGDRETRPSNLSLYTYIKIN